jgi:ABC-type antimicrobial peptide transport system permease subunit
VAATDPNLPLNNVSTLSAVVEHSIARDRFAMMLVSLFGVVAMSLAAVGIYGVLSYTVAQRTRELGVRIALGASGPIVLRHVMRQMIVLIGIGVGVGTLGALAATQAISSQLFGVTVRDPVTFGTVALLLGGVACLASYIPALRATKISPLTALRYE